MHLLCNTRKQNKKTQAAEGKNPMMVHQEENVNSGTQQLLGRRRAPSPAYGRRFFSR